MQMTFLVVAGMAFRLPHDFPNPNLWRDGRPGDSRRGYFVRQKAGGKRLGVPEKWRYPVKRRAGRIQHNEFLNAATVKHERGTHVQRRVDPCAARNAAPSVAGVSAHAEPDALGVVRVPAGSPVP